MHPSLDGLTTFPISCHPSLHALKLWALTFCGLQFFFRLTRGYKRMQQAGKPKNWTHSHVCDFAFDRLAFFSLSFSSCWWSCWCKFFSNALFILTCWLSLIGFKRLCVFYTSDNLAPRCHEVAVSRICQPYMTSSRGHRHRLSKDACAAWLLLCTHWYRYKLWGIHFCVNWREKCMNVFQGNSVMVKSSRKELSVLVHDCIAWH